MLWNSTSRSHLKVTVQIQLALHPCDPFLINNHNMIRTSVEKRFVMLNVKLQLKLRFSRFIDFKACYILPLEQHHQHSLCCSKQACNLPTGTDSLKPCIILRLCVIKSYGCFLRQRLNFQGFIVIECVDSRRKHEEEWMFLAVLLFQKTEYSGKDKTSNIQFHKLYFSHCKHILK